MGTPWVRHGCAMGGRWVVVASASREKWAGSIQIAPKRQRVALPSVLGG